MGNMPDSLEERMALATSVGAPSMVPDFNPPPAKVVEVIPTLQELVTDPKDYLTLKRLCFESKEYGHTQREAAKLLKPITARIKILLGKYRVGKALDGDVRINYYSGERRSINPDKLQNKLLTLGMLPDTIKEVITAATKVKESYTLKITEVGQTDDETDNDTDDE